MTWAIQNLAEHAAKGGKNDSLGKTHLLQLFEVTGALAKEVNSTLEPDLLGRLQRFKAAKLDLRKEVLKGVSPPSIATTLESAELFTPDLFPKEVFLKTDEEAMKSDDKNFFLALQGKTVKRPAEGFTFPFRKKTKPNPVATQYSRNDAYHWSNPSHHSSQGKVAPTRAKPQAEHFRNSSGPSKPTTAHHKPSSSQKSSHPAGRTYHKQSGHHKKPSFAERRIKAKAKNQQQSRQQQPKHQQPGNAREKSHKKH